MTEPDPEWVLAGAGAAAERTAAQAPREISTPAATITGKGTATWKRRGTHGRVRTGQNSRASRVTGETTKTSRSLDAPAPTVTGQARSWRIEEAPE